MTNAFTSYTEIETCLRYAVRDHVPIDPTNFTPSKAAMFLGYVLGVSSELSDRFRTGHQILFWLEYARMSGIEMDVAQGVGEQIYASYSKNLEFIAGVNIGRATAAFCAAGKFRPEMVLDICRYYSPTKSAKDILESVTRYIGTSDDTSTSEPFITEPHATDPRLEYVMGATPDHNLGVAGGWVGDPPIFHSTVAKTFSTLPKVFRSGEDANYWILNNSGRSSIKGARGKVYAIHDDESGMWVLWLEKWEDYFSRPHLCWTAEYVKGK